MHFTTLAPLWLLLACAAIAIFAWRKSLVDATPVRKWAALTLRILGVASLILALCLPYHLTESEDLHVISLVDISESIDPTSIRLAADQAEAAAAALRGSDRSSLLAFANQLAPTTPDALRTLADEIDGGTADAARRNATLLPEALLGSRLLFDSEMARRLIIHSDGVATTPGIPEAIETLRAEGIDVRFHSIPGIQRPEAAIVSITPAATVAYRGEIVRMTLALRANQAMTATARVLLGGVVVASSPVSLTPGADTEVTLDVTMTTTGESRWEAEIIPERDWFPANNRAATTITVMGDPRILVLHRDEKLMRPFARAMKTQGIDLEIRGQRGLPDTMAELLAFDAVILADVPATNLSQRQMQLLKRYVSDFGAGLAMLGSENSFGLGGYYQTPVEEVLPLTSRYEKEKQKPSLAMALVIDKSSSMRGQPIALARASAKAAAELLGAQDQIAVVGFDSGARVILPMTSAASRATILSAIETLDASGGTDVYDGMIEAQLLLQNATAKIKHMIVLSDGQTPANDFAGLARALRSQGVTVSGVALGASAATDIMELISKEGGGRFYQTDDPANMPQIFTQETMQASRSAIKEDLFGAVAVGDHPIIAGYETTELPFILGYVMTQPKPTATLLLAAESGDPLLAISRFGLGTGLAWTSDLTETWAGEWLTWAGGPAFWSQILRGIVRKEQSAGLAATATVNRDTWLIDILRRDEADRPIDNVRWDASAIDATGATVPVAIRQTGVGRYQAAIDLTGRERVALSLRDPDNAVMKTLGWQRDYPAEYRLETRPHPAIAALPTFDLANPRGEIPAASVYRDITHLFVFTGFALLITGLAVRRI